MDGGRAQQVCNAPDQPCSIVSGNLYLNSPNLKNNGSNQAPLPVNRVTDCSITQADTIPSTLQKKRKLILHFDVRNTILVADSVTNDHVEQALNAYLTGVTWGKVTGNGWEWQCNTPSLKPPGEGFITFYKYLERNLVTRPEDRPLLRRALGNFTSENIGKRFRPYFEDTLNSLRWNHQTESDISDGKLAAGSRLTMAGCDGRQYHYILPSFFRLIRQLDADKRDYAIVIRTYGLDAHNVLKCIDRSVHGGHPDFKTPIDLEVNQIPGRITRRDDGSICVNICIENEEVMKSYTKERHIYNFMSGLKGVCGFVDDFQHWQRNDYDHASGKPIWIDTHDQDVHHIFFDDNIRIMDDDSIVDVRMFTERDKENVKHDVPRRKVSSVGQSVPYVDTGSFEDVCLVQADLIESTRNENYFVEKVNLCEKRYETLLKAHQHSK